MSVIMRTRKEEAGALTIVVAVSLVALMGIAALAIDAGRAYVQRSGAQNAADHAALAAAWSYCNNGNIGLARSAGERVAAENGFSPSDYGVAIDPDSGDNNIWYADISGNIGTTFGRALGVEDLAVWAEAKAGCTPGEVVPGEGDTDQIAIFSGGDSCPSSGKDDSNAIFWDTDRATIYGDVHTNGFIWIDGSQNRILDGRLTFVAGRDIKSTNPQILGLPPEQLSAPLGFPEAGIYPTGYFRPGHANCAVCGQPNVHYYSGDRTWSGAIPNGNGIHVVERHLTINTNNLTGDYTFVSLTGRIRLNSNDVTFRPFHNNLLFYAPWESATAPFAPKPTTCSKQMEDAHINLHGDRSKLWGNVVAPRGRVWVDGDDEWFLREGSLIGWAVTLEGDDLTIEGQSAPPDATVTDPLVSLLR